MRVNQEAPKFLSLAKEFARERKNSLLPKSYSYGDIIILPGESIVNNLDEVSLAQEWLPGFRMSIPIISANMSTVTESPMAEFMARIGGHGIIHRAMSIEEQVRQVKEVKNATKYIVEDPPWIDVQESIGRARYLMEEHKKGFVLVGDERRQLLGILSTRDVHRMVPDVSPVINHMRKRDQLVVAPPGVSLEEAQLLMYNNRIEKLPLIDGEGNIGGVITMHDIDEIAKYPLATKDSKGRLRVGAAIGVQAPDALERAGALIDAGVDTIVIDVLHGDSFAVKSTLREVSTMITSVRKLPGSVYVIGGNVATKESTRNLIEAGADVVKVGYGDGSVCTTQIETGTGRSQATAVVECAAEAYKWGKPIIADGAIKNGGTVTKALSLGATSVMIGGLLAGTDESPGVVKVDDITAERYKDYIGMASYDSQQALASARNGKSKKRTPQGIKARVAYRGPAQGVIDTLTGGVISGIANAGGKDIPSLQRVVVWELQSPAGAREGEPHIIYSNLRR